MILGIGIDIVEIQRFEQGKASEAFLKKVFTPKEIQECQQGENAAERYAEIFAIKEAFMKAIGAGIRQEVWFTNIEVHHENTGQVQITSFKKANFYYEALNAIQIQFSCSTSHDFISSY